MRGGGGVEQARGETVVQPNVPKEPRKAKAASKMTRSDLREEIRKLRGSNSRRSKSSRPDTVSPDSGQFGVFKAVRLVWESGKGRPTRCLTRFSASAGLVPPFRELKDQSHRLVRVLLKLAEVGFRASAPEGDRDTDLVAFTQRGSHSGLMVAAKKTHAWPPVALRRRVVDTPPGDRAQPRGGRLPNTGAART